MGLLASTASPETEFVRSCSRGEGKHGRFAFPFEQSNGTPDGESKQITLRGFSFPKPV